MISINIALFYLVKHFSVNMKTAKGQDDMS